MCIRVCLLQCNKGYGGSVRKPDQFLRRYDTGKPVMDNPFVKKQLEAKLEAEKDIIVLYAKSCFLNIQVLSGDLSNLERLEQLGEDLTQAEHRLHRIVAALLNVGVSRSNISCLDEQRRLDLFEAHFADTVS